MAGVEEEAGARRVEEAGARGAGVKKVGWGRAKISQVWVLMGWHRHFEYGYERAAEPATVVSFYSFCRWGIRRGTTQELVSAAQRDARKLKRKHASACGQCKGMSSQVDWKFTVSCTEIAYSQTGNKYCSVASRQEQD